MTIKRSNQIGDTLIEVLVAVTVVGLAITFSYGVANRSLRMSRQSQERSEAAKLTSGQVERLKALALSDDNKGIFDKPGVFCVDNNNNPTPNGAFTSYGAAIKATDNSLTGYPAECVEGNYHMAIQEVSDNEFLVTTRWVGYGSTPTQQVEIKYRLYP